MTTDRRRLLLALGGSALLSAGCMTKPLRPANADGTYCFRTGKSYRPVLTCTTAPIPATATEAEAKAFTGTPERLTVFVIRKRWGDTANVLRLEAPGASSIDLVPETFARWRLAPGRHELTLKWPEGLATLTVDGAAGEVMFVEVVGSVWAWGSHYRLELGQPERSRARAQGLRLVANAN